MDKKANYVFYMFDEDNGKQVRRVLKHCTMQQVKGYSSEYAREYDVTVVDESGAMVYTLGKL